MDVANNAFGASEQISEPAGDKISMAISCTAKGYVPFDALLTSASNIYVLHQILTVLLYHQSY